VLGVKVEDPYGASWSPARCWSSALPPDIEARLGRAELTAESAYDADREASDCLERIAGGEPAHPYQRS
jgi:hypothetical protein